MQKKDYTKMEKIICDNCGKSLRKPYFIPEYNLSLCSKCNKSYLKRLEDLDKEFRKNKNKKIIITHS